MSISLLIILTTNNMIYTRDGNKRGMVGWDTNFSAWTLQRCCFFFFCLVSIYGKQKIAYGTMLTHYKFRHRRYITQEKHTLTNAHTNANPYTHAHTRYTWTKKKVIVILYVYLIINVIMYICVRMVHTTHDVNKWHIAHLHTSCLWLFVRKV